MNEQQKMDAKALEIEIKVYVLSLVSSAVKDKSFVSLVLIYFLHKSSFSPLQFRKEITKDNHTSITHSKSFT